MEKQDILDKKKCGLCVNYLNRHCKKFDLDVKFYEEYPCNSFKNNTNKTLEEYDEKKADYLESLDNSISLEELNVSQYGIKLPTLTNFQIWLKKKKIPPILVSLLVGSIIVALNFIFQNYVDPDNGRQLSFGVTTAFCSLPFLFYVIYYWLIDRFFEWVEELKYKIEKATFNKIILPKIQLIFSNWYLIISIPICIVFTIWINSPSEGFHFGAYLISYLFTWLILGYIAGFAVFLIIIAELLLSQMSKIHLHIQILHSDQFAGQKFQGDFALSISFFVAFGTVAMPIIIEFLYDPDLPLIFYIISLLALIAYPILVILTFIIPIISLNSVLKKERNRMLEQASNNFRIALNNYHFNSGDDQTGVNVMVNQQVFNTIENIKIWPFRMDIIIKLLLSALAPVLVSVIKLSFPTLGGIF